MKKLYALLVKPRSQDQSIKRREVVFNYLLLGTIMLTMVATLLVLYGWITKPAAYALLPIVTILGIFITAVGTIFYLAHNGHYRAAAITLASIYGLAAITLITMWGFRNSQGMVLLAFFIAMVGVLVSARASLFAALLSSGVLVLLSILDYTGAYHPDTDWLKQPSDFADAIGLSIVFGALALVAWLYNREMELSLRRAERSEQALSNQKAQLEVTVIKRTQELQAAQAEKMKQLHHFAELGHVSTALLHDLSNHLALLSLDIESLSAARGGQARVLQQSQRTIRYIEDLVQRVRYQLQGQPMIKTFNVVDEISEAMQLLAYKAKLAHVTLELTADQPRKAFGYHGDFVGFRQIVSNLLNNSVEAYENRPGTNSKPAEKLVLIVVKREAHDLIITITDRGKGIKPNALNKVFEPFYSTRKSGMGIGLFIARQLVEDQFKGHLTVTSKPSVGTVFTIQLPKKRARGT